MRVKIGGVWHEAKPADIPYGPSPEQERLELLMSLCGAPCETPEEQAAELEQAWVKSGFWEPRD